MRSYEVTRLLTLDIMKKRQKGVQRTKNFSDFYRYGTSILFQNY